MKRIIIIILVVLLAITAFLVQGGISSYQRMNEEITEPPEDPKVLSEQAAIYSAVAEDMASRPMKDRKALDAMSEELRPQWEADEKTNGKKWALSECTDTVYNDILAKRDSLLPYRRFDPQIEKVLADGVLIQHGYELQDMILDCISLRFLTIKQMELALLEVGQGETEKATQRILQNLKLTEGYFHIPTILSPMCAIADRGKIHRTILYILPDLKKDQLRQVRSALLSPKDVKRLYLDSIKVESKVCDATFDQADHGEFRGKFAWSFMIWMGFINRERRIHTYLTTKHLAAYEQWIENGAALPPDIGESILQEYYANNSSILVKGGWPKTDTLMRRVWEYDLWVETLVRIIDLKLNNDPIPADIPFPFDTAKHIRFEKGHGCVVTVPLSDRDSS